jgi:Fur family transcriptional regulator, ferric uptake regulator
MIDSADFSINSDSDLLSSSPVKVSPYAVAALRAELNDKGLRMTTQREAILTVFHTLPKGEHLSADDIHEKLKDQYSGISISTVYRTVKMMAKMGVLRELELAEGHKHYELNLRETHHHHLICVRCTRTIEFKSSSVLKVGTAAAEKEAFSILDCQLVVHAICPACQRSLL